MVAEVGLRLGAETFRVRVRGKSIDVARGDPSGAAVVLTVDTEALASAIYDEVPLPRLEKQGLLELEGDRAIAERFVGSFSLPSRA
jgi:hypothetical protein